MKVGHFHFYCRMRVTWAEPTLRINEHNTMPSFDEVRKQNAQILTNKDCTDAGKAVTLQRFRNEQVK